MIKVELVIAERKSKAEPWIRIEVVAVPRVDDLIALDVREGTTMVGRYVRVRQVVFAANPPDHENFDPVTVHATLVGEEEERRLGLD